MVFQQAVKVIEDVPTPFTYGAIFYTRQTGVCAVQMHKELKKDEKITFASHLAEQLGAKYGKPSDDPTTIDENADMLYWWRDEHDIYPNEVWTISITTSTGFHAEGISLTYKFDNFQDCGACVYGCCMGTPMPEGSESHDDVMIYSIY